MTTPTPAQQIIQDATNAADRTAEEAQVATFALYRDDHPIAYLPTLAACRSLIRFEQRRHPRSTFRVYRSVVR